MESGGWDESAQAWIESVGDHGDWSRRYVLDPAMADLSGDLRGKKVLDVGCGEGRWCRWMRTQGAEPIGLDPTATLLETARTQDPKGTYLQGGGEHLPFEDNAFDHVVAYLTLIDIPDFRAAIREMARVLKPGAKLLIANINSFADQGWVKDEAGNPLYFPVDRYLEEYSTWFEWRGIRILNYHRPFSAYVEELLRAGLILEAFQEPRATEGAPDAERYARVPWFHVMRWSKPC